MCIGRHACFIVLFDMSDVVEGQSCSHFLSRMMYLKGQEYSKEMSKPYNNESYNGNTSSYNINNNILLTRDPITSNMLGYKTTLILTTTNQT